MEVNINKFIPGPYEGETMDLFKTKDDVTYATIRGKNFTIRGSKFKDFINRNFYELHKEFIPERDLIGCISDCDTFARLFGEVKPIFRRIARTDDAIYIDLGTPDFEAIEITKDSVSTIVDPPVKFVRTQIQLPIGGVDAEAKPEDLHRLKKYVPFKNEEDYTLFVAWLMSCLNTFGGYPPLFLVGEQGTAKSTTTAFIKDLLDNSTVPLRNLSTSMRDLMIAASNDFILGYDNISKVTEKQSDNLCKLSTGAGFTKRKLYTSNEEIQFLCKNPIVLNSIALSPTRQDLADRSVIVHLRFIPAEQRKTSKEIWESWKQDRPAILGALCHAVSASLRNFDGVNAENLPRMADFAKWVIAGEDRLSWENGTFLKTMQNLRTTMVEDAIDADSTAMAILKLMKERKSWVGSATALLDDLITCIEADKKKYPEFPKLPNHLSRNLNRVSAFLREKGVLFQKSHSGTRSITLSKIDPIEAQAGRKGTYATDPQEAMDIVKRDLPAGSSQTSSAPQPDLSKDSAAIQTAATAEADF